MERYSQRYCRISKVQYEVVGLLASFSLSVGTISLAFFVTVPKQ